MKLDLRLVRYFVAVAQEQNVSRAAERLNISQPALSAAVKQLERQLGVDLLARRGRRIEVTPAGELLQRRGRDLLELADAVVDEVRGRGGAATGRVRLGLSPTARYGVAPELLGACAAQAPALMIYTSENTTGALLGEVRSGRLDLALTFCARPAPGTELLLLREEPAVVHMRADHPLANRESLRIEELGEETVLVASSEASRGFTEVVLAALADAGISPAIRPDPYPDLGLQAVREGLGVVIYTRTAFPARLEGSAFVPLAPELTLPFHLAARSGATSTAVREVLAISQGLPPRGPAGSLDELHRSCAVRGSSTTSGISRSVRSW